ncbi:MAG TPA: hypothetical protein VHD83_02945 [Puia sp.]|nr:hypothetical protein [Puia sp.]
MLPGFLLKLIAAKAQYNGGESALGVRAGGATGITYKYFQTKTFAYEGLVNYNFDKHIDGVVATALLEKQAPLVGNRFSAQIGVGPSYVFKESRFGAAGTLGFDWRVSLVDLSLDWTPAYYFTHDDHFSASNVGVGVRYILNHGRGKKESRPRVDRDRPVEQPIQQ